MTPWKPFAAPLVSLFLLGGCAAGENLLAISGDVSAAGRALVNENIGDRQMVRSHCRSILEQEVSRLRAEGKADDAFAMLRRHYPSLITEKIAQKIIAGLEKGEPINLPPDICGPE